MTTKQGHQIIDCSVCDCAFNHEGKNCELSNIMVSGCCSDCENAEDSMCASFRRK